MNAVPADCRHAARRSFSFVTVATVSLAAHAALVPPPDQFPVASGTDVQLGILADVTAVTASSDGTGHMGLPRAGVAAAPTSGDSGPRGWRSRPARGFDVADERRPEISSPARPPTTRRDSSMPNPPHPARTRCRPRLISGPGGEE